MYELYESDIELWSERQAALLRRMAAGERVNDQVDWENVIEEIDSVGRSEQKELATGSHGARTSAPARCLPGHYAAPLGWRTTIVRNRADIAKLLRDSPRQRPMLDAAIAEELPSARETLRRLEGSPRQRARQSSRNAPPTADTNLQFARAASVLLATATFRLAASEIFTLCESHSYPESLRA